MINISDGFRNGFRADFSSISKDVINTCGRFHSCAVSNYAGRLTDNLNQVAGAGYSSMLFLEWAS
jgi:hypothetical protein